MLPKMLMSIGLVNMILAVLTGFFMPVEYHSQLAFDPRDYFVIAFVGFAVGLRIYQHSKKNES